MKRIFDFLLSFVLLFILCLPLFVLALVVYLKLGKPIIFCQARPGLHGKSFDMFKFRTMTDQRDSEGRLLPDVLRLTGLGRFLRSTSLDELPELWNVLTGDMSLVGPRPLLMQYLPLYSQEEARRHEVRPGITGWAQISGRNTIDWKDKFSLDVWYVDNHNLILDIKILWLTILKVLRRDGVNANAGETMSEFLGSSKSSTRKD